MDLSTLPVAKGPAVGWTVGTAMPLFEHELQGRDYLNGKTMFSAGRCVACRACDRVCPYELDVRKESEGDLCTNCGLCITACHRVLGEGRGVLSLR